MTKVLELRSVVKAYDNKPILKKISFEVNSGEIFGLLGPNGAGKTTIIRVANHITAPDKGKVILKGRNKARFLSKKIGYLPEERGLYKKMKVTEQVLYLAQLKGLTKEAALKKAKIWFDKLEISTWRDRYIEELSKGMQQKVQFVTTVLHEPELLILDEPFSGFDPVNAELIKKHILELKEAGTSIILSTHNMGSVEELCDRIALVNAGEIILTGPVKELRKQYSEGMYSVVFKGHTAVFSNTLWTGGEIVSIIERDEFTEAIVKMSGRISIKDIIRAIIEKVEVVSFNEILPTMNDIFIKLIKK